jgi:hypothetical protein
LVAEIGHERDLGRVVDDPAEIPDALAGGLKLREVHLPDAVAARDRLDERLAALACEHAALTLRAGPLDEPAGR